VHWLFGFKYYVIASEIPNVLTIQDPAKIRSNERKYNIIETIGIVICVAAGLTAAVLRSMITYKSPDLFIIFVSIASWFCVAL